MVVVWKSSDIGFIKFLLFILFLYICFINHGIFYKWHYEVCILCLFRSLHSWFYRGMNSLSHSQFVLFSLQWMLLNWEMQTSQHSYKNYTHSIGVIISLVMLDLQTKFRICIEKIFWTLHMPTGFSITHTCTMRLQNERTLYLMNDFEYTQLTKNIYNRMFHVAYTITWWILS